MVLKMDIEDPLMLRVGREAASPRHGRALLAGSGIDSVHNAPSRPRIPQGVLDFFQGGKSGWDGTPAALCGRGRGEKPGQDAIGFSPGNSFTGRSRRPGSVTLVQFATVDFFRDAKSPCTIPGGRASRRAKPSGSDGASPSRDHERPFRSSAPARRYRGPRSRRGARPGRTPSSDRPWRSTGRGSRRPRRASHRQRHGAAPARP